MYEHVINVMMIAKAIEIRDKSKKQHDNCHIGLLSKLCIMNLMNTRRTKLLKETSLGVATILLVAGFILHEWYTNGNNETGRLTFTSTHCVAALLGFLSFIVGFVMTNEGRRRGIYFMSCGLLGLMLLFSNGFILILSIILIAELATLAPLLITAMISIIIPFLYFPLSISEYVWINAVLFSTFNLFAAFVSHRFHRERDARLKVSHLLRELHATQNLLSRTSKRDERLRIARDIHDVLGHHLTALTLQLEIAEQLGNPESVQHIIRAKNISKLLLSDIRETVSDLRNQTALEIHSALEALTRDHESIDISLRMSDKLTVHDARVAEAVFRTVQEALTNIVKHTQASSCQIDVCRKTERIILTIADDGGSSAPIQHGNGLNGMRERLAALDGSMQLNQNQQGVTISASIPDPQEYL